MVQEFPHYILNMLSPVNTYEVTNIERARKTFMLTIYNVTLA